MFDSINETIAYIKEKEIQFVDFKLVDLRGRYRHLSIPAKRLSEKTMKEGIGFDASNYGYASVEKSDMVFYPDLSRAYLDPFTKQKVLTIPGDVYVIRSDGNVPFGQYPRNVLKAALSYMKEKGIADEMVIAPEFEFSIFDHVSTRIADNEISVHLDSWESRWSSAREDSLGYHTSPAGAYHIDLPEDLHFDLRNEICQILNEMGVEVKYHHHEVGGTGQMEIEVELTDVYKMADDTLLIKHVIRNVALAHGLTATFMPKPIRNEAGNGMHIHMQLRKDGKNLFYKKGNYASLSDEAMYFIGGILKHIASLCVFLNPSSNSYKRLVPVFEAPVTIGYATGNRSAIIRIPSYAKSEDSVRFELRNPDAMCNPYYAYAAILMAGMDGIMNKIDPKDHNWGPFDFNLYDLSLKEKAKLEHLPGNLEEAIAAFEKDHDFLLKGSVFSEELLNNWIKMVEKENEEVRRIPHPMEFQQCYDL